MHRGPKLLCRIAGVFSVGQVEEPSIDWKDEDPGQTKACVEPARSVFLLLFIQKQDLDRTFR